MFAFEGGAEFGVIPEPKSVAEVVLEMAGYEKYYRVCSVAVVA